MSYQLKLSLPNVGKGGTVAIDGLGEFENGKEHTVSEDDALRFRHARATVESTTDKDGVTEAKEVLGPTLVEAFKGVEGIDVSKKAEATKTQGGDKS